MWTYLACGIFGFLLSVFVCLGIDRIVCWFWTMLWKIDLMLNGAGEDEDEDDE